MNNTPRSTPLRPASMLALCIGLWFVAFALSTYALWLLMQPGAFTQAFLVLGISVLITAAGLGLYRMQRWGVILFGLLSLAGSINHIASSITRFAALYSTNPGAAVSSVIGVLGAFLIPVVLIYLILILWRQVH